MVEDWFSIVLLNWHNAHFKAIRCSSLKSGRHDTNALEEEKKGLERGTHSNHHMKGEKRAPQMMNLGRRENCQIKS